MLSELQKNGFLGMRIVIIAMTRRTIDQFASAGFDPAPRSGSGCSLLMG